MKKEKCQVLAARVVAITAAIAAELMRSDRETLGRREANVSALLAWVQALITDFMCSNNSRTLQDIKELLQELSSASPLRRFLKRGEVDDKLSIFHQRLETAMDSFHVRLAFYRLCMYFNTHRSPRTCALQTL